MAKETLIKSEVDDVGVVIAGILLGALLVLTMPPEGEPSQPKAVIQSQKTEQEMGQEADKQNNAGLPEGKTIKNNEELNEFAFWGLVGIIGMIILGFPGFSLGRRWAENTRARTDMGGTWVNRRKYRGVSSR